MTGADGILVRVEGFSGVGRLRYYGPALADDAGPGGGKELSSMPPDVCGVEFEMKIGVAASSSMIERYFKCSPGHGALVPASSVTTAVAGEAAGRIPIDNASPLLNSICCIPSSSSFPSPSSSHPVQQNTRGMPKHRKLGLGLAALLVSLSLWVYAKGYRHRVYRDGYMDAPAISFASVRKVASNQVVHDTNVEHALKRTPPEEVMAPGRNNIGWLVNSFRPTLRINSKGSIMFPLEFQKLGWTKLVPAPGIPGNAVDNKNAASPENKKQQREAKEAAHSADKHMPFVRVGTDWTPGVAPASPLLEGREPTALLQAAPRLAGYFAAGACLFLVAPDRVLGRGLRSFREADRAPHFIAAVAGLVYFASWHSKYYSALAIQAGSFSTTSILVSPDNVLNVPAYSQGIGDRTLPLSLIITMVSPSFHLLEPFKQWQYAAGPGCVLVNHQKEEYKAFQKGNFLRMVHEWSKQNGCDAEHHSVVIPPTYFLTDHATNSQGDSDCAALFRNGGMGNGKEDAVWFQKDPAKDGFGMGVSVHTMDELREMYDINGEKASKDHSGLRKICSKLSQTLKEKNENLLVQRGVEPLLLEGSRKFDIRLYVSITDRAPFALWMHWAYLRFSDSATDNTKSKGGKRKLDRSQHIANINIKKKKHGISQHWYPQGQFAKLMDSAEARPILDKLKLANGKEAAARAEMNILGVLEQSFRAMKANAGTKRGGYLLIGVDILLDENLHAYVLESNVDPEFGNDKVRKPISEQASSSLFQLVAETHAKSIHLFGGSAGPGDHYRGKCFATNYAPVSLNSAAGKALVTTKVPGWTLLYSEAVEPAYSISGGDARTSPKRIANTRGDGFCFQQA